MWKNILTTNEPREDDNSTADDFGYSNLKISFLRDIALAVEGNVAGRHVGLRTK